jgi:DNA-directed RNA polymerase specialized sigma24 family protein
LDAFEFQRRMAMGRAEQSRVIEELLPFIHRCVRSAGAKQNVRNTDVLDDIQQQLCMILLEKWSAYRNEGALEGWICRIALNLIRGYLRSEGRSPILFTVDGEVSDGDPHTLRNGDDQDAGRAEPLDRCDIRPEDYLVERTCLGRALGELSAAPAARKGSKRVFDVLMFMISNDDPSDKELAEFLNTSAGATRERRSQIRKKLRETCMRVCGSDDCRFRD